MLYFIRRRQLLAAISLVCLALASGIVAAAEPLLWKFNAGDVHNYQMVQEMNMTMDIGPTGETSTTVKQTIDMKWEILSVEENGAAVLKQEVSRVRMDITAPGQAEVHYDTASDEPPQGYAAMLAPALTALTNSPLQVTMTPRGEITDVEVPGSLVEALSQGPGGAMLGGLATEEGFKNLTRQNALTLPEPEDLVEGYQWTTSAEVDNPVTGKITTETTYEYKGSREVDGQQFEVFVPTMVINFGGGQDSEGTKIEVKKQQSTGEILFNRTAGLLESMTVQQQMDSAITVGDSTMNQHLAQTIKFQRVPLANGE